MSHASVVVREDILLRVSALFAAVVDVVFICRLEGEDKVGTSGYVGEGFCREENKKREQRPSLNSRYLIPNHTHRTGTLCLSPTEQHRIASQRDTEEEREEEAPTPTKETCKQSRLPLFAMYLFLPSLPHPQTCSRRSVCVKKARVLSCLSKEQQTNNHPIQPIHRRLSENPSPVMPVF